ncbi:hypothetical protein HDV00_002621 [Rhizophlyctis rosea]|nr:hypothetical protein HDV00_002621 [Rhizophlyctis rosea]
MGICQSSDSPAAEIKISTSMTQTSDDTARSRGDSFKYDTAGRRIHADFTPLSEDAVPSDKLYILPNDDEEMDRLHLQHYAIRLLFGSNFSAPATKFLSEPGTKRKVLDLACGSGIWAFEMATAFPTCHVTGIDISPVQPSTVKPKNVEFLVGDLTNVPLPFPDAAFDFVHMGLVFLALRAEFWPVLIKEIVRIVKPGGWIELMEPSNIVFQGQTRVPNLARMMIEGQQARGIDVHVASKLQDYLSSQSPMTEVQVVTKELHMKADPTNKDSVRLARMMAEDGTAALSGLKAAFVAKGVCKEEEYDTIVREHIREVAEGGHVVYWTRCFGRKADGPPVGTH